MAETASQADDIFGEKLYQVRAKKALPILVRQALSRNPISYTALATELAMPNPRNLNYVLGSIGTTLNQLSSDTGLGEIPHIQSIVVNQKDWLPGKGFDSFLAQRMERYQSLPLAKKQAYLSAYWHEVYAYPHWQHVLEACNLVSATNDAVNIAVKARTGRSAGGGEGEEHRRLKEYVAANPGVIGLSSKLAPGLTEAPIPSGDKIDVLFHAEAQMIAAEVKSVISNDVDLARGLFQCVKYRAVMEAERGFKREQYSVDAILVVGKPLPQNLYPLQSSLGIRVVVIPDCSLTIEGTQTRKLGRLTHALGAQGEQLQRPQLGCCDRGQGRGAK